MNTYTFTIKTVIEETGHEYETEYTVRYHYHKRLGETATDPAEPAHVEIVDYEPFGKLSDAQIDSMERWLTIQHVSGWLE